MTKGILRKQYIIAKLWDITTKDRECNIMVKKEEYKLTLGE